MKFDSSINDIFSWVELLCFSITLGLFSFYSGILLCKRKSFVVKEKTLYVFTSFLFFFPLVRLFHEFDSTYFLILLSGLSILTYGLTSKKTKYGLFLFNFTENELHDMLSGVFEDMQIEFDFKKTKFHSRYIFRNYESIVTIHFKKYSSSGLLRFIKPNNIPSIDNIFDNIQHSLNGKPFKYIPVSGKLLFFLGFLITAMSIVFFLNMFIDIL